MVVPRAGYDSRVSLLMARARLEARGDVADPARTARIILGESGRFVRRKCPVKKIDPPPSDGLLKNYVHMILVIFNLIWAFSALRAEKG